jgi:hypothetical protein
MLLLSEVEETFVDGFVKERVEFEDVVDDNFATAVGGDFECDEE